MEELIPAPKKEKLLFDGDDAPWNIRSEFWSRRAKNSENQRSKRERPRQPLVITGHGASLRIDGGSLLVKNGFTHYPQKQEIHRFFRGELSIPERIILLNATGSLSFDVLSWLTEQDVSLVKIDWRGNVVCVSAKSGYAANPYRVRWQRELRENVYVGLNLRLAKSRRKSKAQLRRWKNRSGATMLGIRRWRPLIRR